MTNLSLNVWSYPQPSFTDVNDSNNATRVDPFSNVYLDDSIRSLLGTTAGLAQIYNALSSNPVLPPPGETISIMINGREVSLNGVQVIALEATISHAYGSSFFNSLDEMVSSGTMTPAQKNEAIFYFLHPDVAPQSPIKGLLDTAIQDANKDFFPNGTTPPGFQPQENQQFFAQLYDRETTESYDTKFEAIINAKVAAGTLSPAAAKTLIFQHYHRAENAPLTSDEQQALQFVQQQYGYPTTDAWSPTPNTDRFDGMVMSEFDSGFDQQLALLANNPAFLQLVSDSGLSKEFVLAALKYQHYHSAATITEFDIAGKTTAADFKTLFNSMSANALAYTRGVTGIPNDFSPETAAMIQDGIFNGAYRDTVMNKLMDYQNGAGIALSTEDMNKIAQWFTNPNSVNLPDNLKAIAQQIKQDAISEIRGKYNLPGVWLPENINSFANASSPVHRALQEVQSQLDLAIIVASSFSQPQQGMYLSFLRQVSNMLKELKDSLYELEAADSARARGLSASKLEQTMEKLKKQAEDHKKELEAKQKAASMEAMGKCFAPLMKFLVAALLVVMTLGAGAVALPFMGTVAAIAVSDFADSCGAKTALAEKLFTAIDNACGGKGSAGATILKFIVMSAIVVGSGVAAIEMGPDMLQKCGLIQAIVKACGGDEQAQELAASIIVIIIGIVVAIGIAVASCGTATAASVAKIAADIAKQLPKILKTIFEAIIKTLQTASKDFPRLMKVVKVVVESAMDIIQASGQIAHAAIMKQLLEHKGDVDAAREIIEAMIKIVQKVLEKFLESIQGESEFVASVNKTMAKNWSQLSQSLTGLTQA